MKPKAIDKFPKNKDQTGMGLKWILPVLGIATLILGIWIGVFLENKDESVKSVAEQPVVFNVVTMEIARQFMCPCGSCSHENLAICECPTAISTKRFIESNVDRGLEKMEVIDIVKQVYGNYRG